MVGTLGYAILGLLAIRPQTGYELAQRMKVPIGYMWTAHHSQIYPELARLTDNRFVHPTPVVGRGPRQSKRYRITATGRRALSAWTTSPMEEINRSELMLRVRALWLVDHDRARRFLTDYRSGLTAQLAAYAAEEADFARLPQRDHPGTRDFFEYATLRYGFGHLDMVIAWCDELLDALNPTNRATSATSTHPPAPPPG